MSTQHPPESPWLPLLKTKRPGFGDWLRANHTWLISLAAIAVSIYAVVRSDTYARQTDARLKRERRPWLSVGIAKDTLNWSLGNYYASYTIRNVGKGPALWFYGMSVRLDTRRPVALYGSLLTKPAPTRMLAPGESTFMLWRAYDIDTAPRESASFYVHYLLVYGGTDREDTLFQEQVFYVNTKSAGPTALWQGPSSGPERAYAGSVKGGRVLLDGEKTPDQDAVDRANSALGGILNRRGPKVAGRTHADSTRLYEMCLNYIRDSVFWATCADSLKLLGFGTDAIEYSRAYAAEVIRALRSGVPLAELDSAFPGTRRPPTD